MLSENCREAEYGTVSKSFGRNWLVSRLIRHRNTPVCYYQYVTLQDGRTQLETMHELNTYLLRVEVVGKLDAG